MRRLFWTIQTLLRAFNFYLVKMFTSTRSYVNILTLYVYILIEYFYFVYANFSLRILGTRFSVFVQLLLN